MKISYPNSLSKSIAGLSILDRYLFIELLLPFLFGIGLFTSLGIAVGTLFELVRQVTESGLSIVIALQILMLKMPEFLTLAFPMAILLATLMAYSRLAADSELTALKSVGISPYRIIIPGLILGLMATGFTFLCNNYITPSASYQAKLIMAEALKDQQNLFKENNILYPEYKKIKHENGSESTVMNRLFYAKNFQDQKMQDLTIIDRSQPGLSQIVTAQSATWNAESNRWDFFNGTVYLIAPDGSYRNIIRFNHQELDLPQVPLDFSKKEPGYGEMSLQYAQEYLNILEKTDNQKKILKLKVKIQEKIALPFVCLVFSLIGSGLGLRPQNTNKATSFGICVGLIFAYYLFSFVSSSLGILGLLSPVFSAWLPNILGFSAGSFLLIKSSS
jgi:lipopolysaccharide export system permease protein